jgi:hypothetical protein
VPNSFNIVYLKSITLYTKQATPLFYDLGSDQYKRALVKSIMFFTGNLVGFGLPTMFGVEAWRHKKLWSECSSINLAVFGL